MAEARGDGAPYGRTLRRLHLGIGLLTIVLATTGFMIYFRKPLGLSALKLSLMYVHATIAYGLVALLGWRIVLFFRGAESERLKSVIAGPAAIGKFFGALKSRKGRVFAFAGRSPFSRVVATVLYLAFLSNAASGLVRAGTDLYYPPFGAVVKNYLASPGVDPSTIKRDSREGVDPSRMSRMNKIELFFGKIHIYGGFLIVGLAALHAGGVMATEWSAPNNRSRRGRARIMLFGPQAPRP